MSRSPPARLAPRPPQRGAPCVLTLRIRAGSPGFLWSLGGNAASAKSWPSSSPALLARKKTGQGKIQGPFVTLGARPWGQDWGVACCWGLVPSGPAVLAIPLGWHGRLGSGGAAPRHLHFLLHRGLVTNCTSLGGHQGPSWVDSSLQCMEFQSPRLGQNPKVRTVRA